MKVRTRMMPDTIMAVSISSTSIGNSYNFDDLKLRRLFKIDGIKVYARAECTL
jgi:hypothetical protein